LRPTVLGDLGLAAALGEHVGNWSRQFGVAAHMQSEMKERLPPAMETALYRIAQEALNNVAKHADARNVYVALERRADDVVMTVRDDGDGFDVATVRPDQGLGLVSMRERASSLGGSATIEGRPGAGTVVTVRVPMPRQPEPGA
jgi:signal transduction histidine kinase